MHVTAVNKHVVHPPSFLFFSQIIDPSINGLLNKVNGVDLEDYSEIENREKKKRKEKYTYSDKSKVLLSMTYEWPVGKSLVRNVSYHITHLQDPCNGYVHVCTRIEKKKKGIPN